MFFASAPIWNEIANTQQLQTKWAMERFSLDMEQINEAWDKEADQLKSEGMSSAVILGYLTVKPLLLESIAISQFIMDSERIDLRMALPEICTIDEAVKIASMDHPLNKLEQMHLKELLQRPVA